MQRNKCYSRKHCRVLNYYFCVWVVFIIYGIRGRASLKRTPARYASPLSTGAFSEQTVA